MKLDAVRKSHPDTIVIEIDAHLARELANYLDRTDMHLGVYDRLTIAWEIKKALKA